MSDLVSFWIDGIPATQGSKTPGRNGYGFHESDKKLPAWRKAVKDAAESVKDAFEGPLDFPLSVQLDVYLPAPKRSKFGKYPAGTPDLDKLQRAVGDGLTASGLIKDDARICLWKARKHWSEEGTGPGAKVSIRDLRDENYIPAELPETVTLRTEAHEFALNQALGTALVKVRGMVPMPDGRLQEVELVLGGKMAEQLQRGMAQNFSIQAPARSALTPEAYARMSRSEIERIYGEGEL